MQLHLRNPRACRLEAHRVARQVDPDRQERDAIMDLHHVILQVAVLKATSLCLRARSWNAIPTVTVAADLEDPVSSLADAGTCDEV